MTTNPIDIKVKVRKTIKKCWKGKLLRNAERVFIFDVTYVMLKNKVKF